MKLLLLLLLAALTAFPIAAFSQTTEWKEFISTELNFKVTFPGLGREVEKGWQKNQRRFQFQLPDQDVVTLYDRGRIGLVQTYMVDIEEAPEYQPNLTNEQLIAEYDKWDRGNAHDRVWSDTLISKKDVSLNGRPGREHTLYSKKADSEYLILKQSFIVGSRIYMVVGMVQTSSQARIDPTLRIKLRKFVDSFEFLDTSARN